MPSVGDICNARAGILFNLICFPFVCSIGLTYKSFRIFCIPCLQILFLRCARIVWRFCCCCCGWPYQDDSFFGAKALGDFSSKNASEMNKDTDWVRAQDLEAFGGKRPQLFEGDIEPADLCQGTVGNCWLVAAFACASEFPDFVRNIFVTKEYNPRGLYKVRIYDPQHKKWETVVVDDRIPCEKGTKRPRFMNPNGNELWAIILEKAYAKFCGSYAKLASGIVSWGWHSMTGDHVFQMSRKNDDKDSKQDSSCSSNSSSWVREDIVIFNDEEDRRKCAFRVTNEKYTANNIWTLLKKYDRQKALISASIGNDIDFRNNGPQGEQIFEKEGLEAGHAYSVIQVKEIKKRSGQTKNFRLLHLRNPWGTFEWNGDWSDKSRLWKVHPHVAQAVKFVDDDSDGCFWMCFDDFIDHYTRINICDRTTKVDVALDINEDSGSCGIVTGWIWGCFEYWCFCLSCRNLYCGHYSTDDALDAQERGCCCGRVVQ